MPHLEEGHYHLAVEITPDQAQKAYLGKPIQIQHHQFGKGHLFVDHENHLKLARAHKAGRGVRIHLGPGELMHTAHHHVIHKMDGTGIFGKIWSGLKSGFNWLKKTGVLTNLVDKAATAVSAAYPEAAPVVGFARNQLKERTGIGARRMPKKTAGSGLYLS